MPGLVKFLLPVALVLSGCGAEALRRFGLKEVKGTATNAVAFDQAFVVGCGPTTQAPETLHTEDFETFGCTIFSKSEHRKVESVLRIVQINVFPASSSSLARPATAEPEATSVWHAYFNLPTGIFATVSHVEVKAVYGDAEITLQNDGLIVYDPEGLSDRDEQENTFVVRKLDEPTLDFKKIDGHFLFVTALAMIPGQDFNSVAGADLRCSIEAQQVVALASYQFAALLSDESHDLKERVSLHGPIRDLDKTVIIENGEALYDSAGFSSPLKVINGDLASSARRVWTGSASGAAKASGKTCTSWSSKDPAGVAAFGDPSTEQWLDAGEDSCAKGYSLYCISR